MNEKENRDKVFNFLVQELAFLDNNYDRFSCHSLECES